MDINEELRKLHREGTNESFMKMGKLIKEYVDKTGAKPKYILGRIGNTKEQRERYRKRVLEEKRFQCNVCEKLFTTSSSHKSHMKNKSCEKWKLKQCKKCLRIFADKKNLKYHTDHKVCDKIKNKQCHKCLKIFDRRRTRDRHLKKCN